MQQAYAVLAIGHSYLPSMPLTPLLSCLAANFGDVGLVPGARHQLAQIVKAV